MADEGSLDTILASPNVGQRYIYGGYTKAKYGYFGQGEFIPAVAKEDIRARPAHFICANCRQDFTVTPTEVYCKTCSRVTELSQINVEQLVKRVAAVQKHVEELPPPVVPEILAHKYDLAEMDLGRTVNASHKKILADKGVVSLYDVRERGIDGLIAITGIGEKVATALMAVALEVDLEFM